MDNDSKAIDLKYKSSIEFMGKVRKLGRTNMAIRREIARIGEEVSKLGELDNKEFNKLMRDMKKIVKQLISPITLEELDDIDAEDWVDITTAIQRRGLKRRGYTDKQIQEMEAGEREAMVKVTADAVDFQQMMKETMGPASSTGTQKDS
jgi:hypothetical protein